jgi:hypothetical protein
MSAVKLSKVFTKSSHNTSSLKSIPNTNFSSLGLGFKPSVSALKATPLQTRIIKPSHFQAFGKPMHFHTSKFMKAEAEAQAQETEQKAKEEQAQQQTGESEEITKLKETIAELENKLKYSLAERESILNSVVCNWLTLVKI